MYRKINRLVLLAVAFVTAAVFALHFLTDYKCPFLAACGRPCLLCGCTRDFMDMLSGSVPRLNPFSPCLFAFSIVELLWRAVGCIWEFNRAVAVIDIVCHILILGAVLSVNVAVLFGLQLFQLDSAL